jgi:hypothetical protein
MKTRRTPVALILAAVAALSLATLSPPARSQTAGTVSAVAAVSVADNARAYRKDAAHHIYATYPDKIYKGKLPPLVHAIVVLDVELDATGAVREVRTIRVPTHAPDVTAAVKEMIHRASPMPAPSRMGGVTFTEIWLVDKSGRFQLDTLTEGQL